MRDTKKYIITPYYSLRQINIYIYDISKIKNILKEKVELLKEKIYFEINSVYVLGDTYSYVDIYKFMVNYCRTTIIRIEFRMISDSFINTLF